MHRIRSSSGHAGSTMLWTVLIVLLLLAITTTLWTWVNARTISRARDEVEQVSKQVEVISTEQKQLLTLTERIGALGEKLDDLAAKTEAGATEQERRIADLVAPLETLLRQVGEASAAEAERSERLHGALNVTAEQVKSVAQAVDRVAAAARETREIVARHDAILADMQQASGELKRAVAESREEARQGISTLSRRLDPLQLGEEFLNTGEPELAVALLKLAAYETTPQGGGVYESLRQACNAAAERNRQYKGEYVRFLVARISDPEVRPEESQALFKAQSEEDRLAVLEGLRAAGHEIPARVLTTAMADADADVRGRALRSLAPAAASTLLPELSKVLLDETATARVRVLAARKIDEIASEEADAILLQAHQQAEQWRLRRSLHVILLERRTRLFDQVLTMDRAANRDLALHLLERVLRIDPDYERALTMKRNLESARQR